MSSIKSCPDISSWLNVWQCRNSPKYRAFLLPEFQKSYWKNEGWHWGVLRLFRELNPHKGSFGALQSSIYRLISDFSAKNSTQSFGLGFSGFHEMWKLWNRVLLYFSPKYKVESLSAICEPFSTASAAGRETTPPMTVKGTVNDLWASCGRYIESRSRLLSME